MITATSGTAMPFSRRGGVTLVHQLLIAEAVIQAAESRLATANGNAIHKRPGMKCPNIHTR